MIFNKKSKLDKLNKLSKDIVGVFTRTVTDLHTVNSTLDEHHDKQLEQKEKIERELADLQAIKADNVNIIENIGKIFPVKQ